MKRKREFSSPRRVFDSNHESHHEEGPDRRRREYYRESRDFSRSRRSDPFSSRPDHESEYYSRRRSSTSSRWDKRDVFYDDNDQDRRREQDYERRRRRRRRRDSPCYDYDSKNNVREKNEEMESEERKKKMRKFNNNNNNDYSKTSNYSPEEKKKKFNGYLPDADDNQKTNRGESKWGNVREKNSRMKEKMRGGKKFVYSEFLKERKILRDSVDIADLKKYIYPDSPVIEMNKSGYVYDLSTVVESESDDDDNENDNDDKEKEEEEETQNSSKEKKSKKKSKKLIFKQEKFIGPRKLVKFDKDLEFRGLKLLDGEGDAMAKFITEKKRIPKRGELIDEDRIKELETLGYVMSGSRNRRMTSVAKMKEGEVRNVYEQYLYDFEKWMDMQKHEVKVRGKLKRMVEDQRMKDKIC